MCDFKKNLDSRHININGIIISAKENSKEALKRHLFFYECPSALEEKMGMTGCRKTMLRIVAYHGKSVTLDAGATSDEIVVQLKAGVSI